MMPRVPSVRELKNSPRSSAPAELSHLPYILHNFVVNPSMRFVDRKPRRWRDPAIIGFLIEHLFGCGLLADEELDRVASLLTVRRVEKGARLLTPGEICAFEGFVARGCLRVFFDEPDGSERVLYFAPEGWCATDIESFLLERPATLGIDALEATDLVLIERSNLGQLCTQVPGCQAVLRSVAESFFMILQRRLVGSLRKTAMQRYQEFLTLYPGLDERIPQYHIAAYLGISAEFLSKLRKRQQPSDADGLAPFALEQTSRRVS
jgi:CRP-like cAMP-binding protein